MAGQQTQVTTSHITRSTSALDKHSNAVRKTETLWKRMAATLSLAARGFAVVLGVGKVVAFTTAIGVAGQAVSQLAGGAVALASRVGSLGAVFASGIAGITGIGLAAATAKLAFSGFSQAMGGNVQAMRRLTPQARELLVELRHMRPLFTEMKRSAQGGLFTGLLSSLGDLRRIAPTINAVLSNMSNVLGKTIAAASHRFTQRGFLGDFMQISGQGASMVGALGRSLGNLVDALRHVAVAAAPFTNWLTKTVEGWSKYIERRGQVGAGDGTARRVVQPGAAGTEAGLQHRPQPGVGVLLAAAGGASARRPAVPRR